VICGVDILVLFGGVPFIFLLVDLKNEPIEKMKKKSLEVESVTVIGNLLTIIKKIEIFNNKFVLSGTSKQQQEQEEVKFSISIDLKKILDFCVGFFLNDFNFVSYLN
jgi:hypothetical protein